MGNNKLLKIRGIMSEIISKMKLIKSLLKSERNPEKGFILLMKNSKALIAFFLKALRKASLLHISLPFMNRKYRLQVVLRTYISMMAS